MTGIPFVINGKTQRHAAIWADAKEVPTIFIAVAYDGSTGLVHPERVSELLEMVQQNDIDIRDAWVHLLIKTPAMDYPQPCEVVASTLDSVLVMVNGESVYRLNY